MAITRGATANPQRCPNPGPDNPGRPGWRGEMDKDYADYVKAQINEPPTPRDIGFRLLNPVEVARRS